MFMPKCFFQVTISYEMLTSMYPKNKEFKCDCTSCKENWPQALNELEETHKVYIIVLRVLIFLNKNRNIIQTIYQFDSLNLKPNLMLGRSKLMKLLQTLMR